ncbi:autotransporter-associated beta strand repeat-containing protein [Kitasatospora sp. NPDC051914]|uniref:autotransporter-associated beta strand repeat-containing protein n=1 Tax=Kitasatospora sp. NPDC051914 TaxID=3154945 RepID=UPI00343852B2
MLRTTALPSGYVLLDGPEMWGRLNLFAAADGYGAFDEDVCVVMNAADGGFAAADAWRHDIDGCGSLTKRGTGALALSGTNRYEGGTVVAEGVLTAASRDALGRGDVEVRGGRLHVDAPVGGARVCGDYLQSGTSELEVTIHHLHASALDVRGRVTLGQGARLSVRLADIRGLGREVLVPVIGGGPIRGEFASVTVDAEGYRAVPVSTGAGLSLRLTRR